MMKNAVCFLDLDGVLVLDGAWRMHKLPLPEQERARHSILPQLVERLNRITLNGAAAIVVSSMWRVLFPTQYVRWLMEAGVLSPIIGATPDLMPPNDGIITISCRGREIAQWRNENRHVGPYVVIDDSRYAGQGHEHNFVHCNGDVGLTDADVEKAISILTRPA